MANKNKFMWKPDKDRDSFANWFIPSALAGKNGDGLLDKITKNVTPEARKKNGYAVTMQINGIEVPCEQAFVRMGDEFERLIKKDAEEMANDLFRKKLMPYVQFFDNLFDGVSKKIALKVKKQLGIKIEINEQD